MQNIPDDSDDLKPGRLHSAGSETEATTDGILSGPETANCGLVDDEHGRSAVAITLGELSTPELAGYPFSENSHAHPWLQQCANCSTIWV
jgi:hypothetical protein